MFKITTDHIHSPDDQVPSAAGRCYTAAPLYGYERAAGVDGSIPNTGPLVKFRLLDDDGEVYYVGQLNDDDECANQSAALRWGETVAGCTTIQVWRGEWKTEIG